MVVAHGTALCSWLGQSFGYLDEELLVLNSLVLFGLHTTIIQRSVRNIIWGQLVVHDKPTAHV